MTRLHSKAKREQLRSQLNLETGKARLQRPFGNLQHIFDGEDESPALGSSAEEAKSFFKQVYSTQRLFERSAWLPEANQPHCTFGDDPISIM